MAKELQYQIFVTWRKSQYPEGTYQLFLTSYLGLGIGFSMKTNSAFSYAWRGVAERGGGDFQYSPDGFVGVVSMGDMGRGGEGRVTRRLGWLEYLKE